MLRDSVSVILCGLRARGAGHSARSLLRKYGVLPNALENSLTTSLAYSEPGNGRAGKRGRRLEIISMRDYSFISEASQLLLATLRPRNYPRFAVLYRTSYSRDFVSVYLL